MAERDGAIELPTWLRRSAAWTWRLLLLLVAVVLAVWIMVQLALVTLPVIVALILATLCVPVADRLERQGVKPALAALIVVVGGLAAIGGIVAAMVPSFLEQILELRPTVQAGFDNILEWLEEGPLGYDRQQLEDLLSQVSDRASSSGGQIASGVLTGAAAVASGLAALALTIVLLFFFVKDRAEITAWFLARTPERYRATGSAVAQRAWGALSGYVRGTATIALIDATGIGIGLAILGVPLVLPLALLVFLGAFIPVIGALLAGLVAVLVALADGGFTAALLVLALIVLVQQLEGNVLQPIIMRRAVALHPVVVLIALAAGASLAGIVGAFLSVPVAAVLAAAGNELRLRQEATRAAPPEDGPVQTSGA
ncbi:MAG: AI-2E family transporter [Actinobacteria bacterium]|nr:AI-2E family transporter [Actinomycetota bacterium]